MPATAPAGAAMWWAGARPRTLGASVVPVLAGIAAASTITWWRAAAAMTVAVGLQAGVNYANDYSDGVRGVDAHRVGPVRLTASGLASPAAVRMAAFRCFAVAAAAGAALALSVDWRLLIVGAFALAAALAYSGGPKPYAGMGLGEVFVFVFFGPVAVAGTAYATGGPTGGGGGLDSIPPAAWWIGCAIGSYAVAILLANNIRDIPTDAAAGKRTLPVRLGDAASRALYRSMIADGVVVIVAGVALGGVPAWALLSLASLPFAARPLRAIGTARGPAMVPVLLRTALVHAVFGSLIALGLTVERMTA